MRIRRRYKALASILLVSMLFSGCMFSQLQEEMEEFEEDFYIIGGVITNRSPHQKDIVVVTYEDTPDKKVAVKAIILESSGDYTMEVKRGNYFLLAFEDRNGNLDPDPDEFVGWYGNPDRIEAASASRFGSYSIAGVSSLSRATHQTVHGGYDPTFANEDPNRVLPLDAVRELEAEGVFGSLHDFYYATVGNGTSVASAEQYGGEIAKILVADGVEAVILTST